MYTVETVMTPDPVTVRPSLSIWEALERLEDCHVRHLPVVDDRHRLVGMLSDRDLRPWRQALRDLREGEASGAAMAALDQPVSQLMSAAVQAVEETDPLEQALAVLIGSHVGAVPVVELGSRRLVGIVSYEDLLELLGDFIGEPVPA